MTIKSNTKFLIIGLGLMGGSYAKGLKKAGYYVSAISDNADSINYALKNNIINKGADFVDEKLIKDEDIIIFALYPQVSVNWIEKYGNLIKDGTIITDVTGVKGAIIYKINSMLKNNVEFIAAHAMAGREVYGVVNSDENIFINANYIVVPTSENTQKAINICKDIGEIFTVWYLSFSLYNHAKGQLSKFIYSFLLWLYIYLYYSVSNCSNCISLKLSST